MGGWRLYFFFFSLLLIQWWGRKRRRKKKADYQETQIGKSLLVLPCLLKVFLGFRFWFSLIELSIPVGRSFSPLSWFSFVFIYFVFLFLYTCILLSVSPSRDRQTPGLHVHVWRTHERHLSEEHEKARAYLGGVVYLACVPFEYRSRVVQCCCVASLA